MATYSGQGVRRRRQLIAVAAAAGALLAAAVAASPATAQDAVSAGASGMPVAPPPSADQAFHVPAPGSPEALQQAEDAGVTLEELKPTSLMQRKPAKVPRNNNCSDMNGCMWHYESYQGAKHLAYPSQADNGWLSYGNWFLSDKNRFNNRRFQVGNQFLILACLNPGDNVPSNVYNADRFNVGGSGSNC